MAESLVITKFPDYYDYFVKEFDGHYGTSFDSLDRNIQYCFVYILRRANEAYQ